MIPSGWTPCTREDDGELIGFLRPAAQGLAAPTSVFGADLGAPMPEPDAMELLLGMGLAYLAERWLLDEPTGPREVVIVEASPARVVVADSAFALVVGHLPERQPVALATPATSLRLA